MKLSRPDPDFSAMKTKDIRASDASRWIAVLPLGATEQHGPHLPLETDTIIAQAVAEQMKEETGDRYAITFLPVEPIGYSPEHLDFTGSKSLGFADAVEKWIGIGHRLNSLGIRKLVLLNAHGGNSPLMAIVATELRVRYNMLCVATSWTRFGYPEHLIDDAVAAIDIHGGDIETSVMLAIRPDLVEMSKAESFPSRQSEYLTQNKWLTAYGRHAFGWKIQDLNSQGVVGNASAANAEKGRALLKHAVAGLVELIDDVDRFDLTQLK